MIINESRLKIKFCFLFVYILCVFSPNASGQYFLKDSSLNFTLLNKYASFIEDPSGRLTINDVINNQNFLPPSENASFGLTSSTFWFKINIQNNTTSDDFVLGIANGTIDSFSFYKEIKPKSSDGTSFLVLNPMNAKFSSQNPFSLINIRPYESETFYIKVKSNKPLVIPIYTATLTANIQNILVNNVIFSIYLGIVAIMFFYNFFIFFTTHDRSYLYYIIYIFFLLLTQVCLQGYLKLLPENYHSLIYLSIPLSTSLVGIFSTLFIKHFLELKKQMKWADTTLNVFIAMYFVAIILSFANYLIIAQILIQANTLIGILIALYAGIKIQGKGYRPAVYFNISWSFFLLSVVVFILKDASIIPFTLFTNNSILIGSSISITLLSFALADKINVYKKEKAESQAMTLSALQENERIIREQNITLEAKVHERTTELQASNEELGKTLQDLKETETQLVESEKMASLGQLTAGIAHEINNPINFVTSNVNPLKRDVDLLVDMIGQIETVGLKNEITSTEKQQEIERIKEEIDYDYLKTEIDYLIKGIGDGASRTAEIVKGLRVFSRLDEDDLKKADVNEGLSSTIVIVNHLLNNLIEVEKNFSGIPMIECYPGKLNQVFLNMLSNAIHAIHERWEEAPGGKLTLATWNDDDQIFISIKDNGTGMDENTKKKLFEPFFTTKDVGEGTGLGLSIAYNTIKKHNGTVEIKSAVGEGTEFILTLPIYHK